MEKYNDMINDMENDVNYFFNHFEDKPENLSGWGHNYFCEVDGEKLTFKQSSPKLHYCKICNHNYTGKKYDDAWIYLNRLQSFFEIVKSAYLFKHLNDEKYLGYAKNTLLYYATNYEKFQLHAKDVIITSDLTIDVGGAGKIMPQGLNEGYMLILIVKALTILGDKVSEEERNIIKEQLVRPAIEDVLVPQIVRIHNIVCWIECGIAVSGFYFNEQRWIDHAFVGAFNIPNQLKDGVTKNHLWYEGSIHYHFFMLEAMMNLMVYPEADALMKNQKEVIKKMLISAYEYAFDNDHFPNPNDGWPDINLKTYLHVYHMAAKVFEQDEQILEIITKVENSSIKRMPIPLGEPYFFEHWSLEKLLFNRDSNLTVKSEKRKSYLFEDSNFAMLRNERINLFMKFGHNGPSHAHPDKMTFELTVDDKIISRDLSNAGYGAQICNEWQRMSVSHNTIVVDGQNHDNVESGIVLHFSDNKVETTCKNVYPGVDFTRKFEISTTTITDMFIVQSEEIHTYDYFLHLDGNIKIDGSMSDDTNLEYDTNGYQHIKNVRKINNLNVFEIIANGVTGKIIMDETAEVFVCETLDNPVTKCRDTLILRKRGSNVVFHVIWEF